MRQSLSLNLNALRHTLRWLLLLAPGLLHAQISLPGIPKASPPALEMGITEQRAKAENQLAETQRQRETEPQVNREIASAEGVKVADRQRLLDRLAFLQTEKIKRLDELVSLQKLPPAAAPTLFPQGTGDAPFLSALAVDAMRDDLDGLRDKLKELNAGLQLRELEKQTLIEQLRRAEETLRQSNDRLAKAVNPAARSEAILEQELTALRQRVAEAELAVLDIDAERRKLQAVHLQKQIEAAAQQVSSALSKQQLSETDLQEQRSRMNLLRDKLREETHKAEQRRLSHEKERQTLFAQTPEPGTTAGQRLQLIDLALSTDGVVLDGLNGLDMLLQVTSNAWEKRYLILADKDQEQHRAAMASLDQLYQGLVNRKPLSQEQRAITQAAIRVQEVRLSNLPADNPERTLAKESLALLQEQATIHERVELAASLLERQLARWREDFSVVGDTSLIQRAAFLTDQVRAGFQALWQYELFAVEDMSSIDGRKITVNYGVTVGKSVGAILLFILGYRLFSYASRWFQGVLVRRFGISDQLASVIRRWIMILLGLGLLVFVLNLARIPLTVFAFMGGALAIGVGFGTQTIIKNFISGIIILFERKIRIGDIIELGGMTGHVTSVDLRATTVRGFNGVEALVPNSSFLENQVVNWTYSNPQIRRELNIGIAYGSDSKAAEALLLKAAVDHQNVLKTPPPEVFFEDFGDNALLLSLVFWVELGPNLVARRVDSELRHNIYRRLAEAGIAIPFPQRDVHLDVTRPVPVTMVAPYPEAAGASTTT